MQYKKILIASDKFKGTFSSKEIGEMIASAIKEYAVEFQTEITEVSDGGDGLIDCLRFKNNFSRWKFLSFSANKARKLQSKYLYNIYTSTAVLESAATLGLSKLRKDEKNILKLSSYGLGYDISRLLEVRKPKRIVIGVGGTSTNDLFLGGASALGFKFLDKDGNEVDPVPENFLNITTIIKPDNFDRYQNIQIDIATDVKNPLCGEFGASRVYAPQKGATAEQVDFLDKALMHVAEIIKKDLGVDVLDLEGAGAGGGIGGGIAAFLCGKIISGADFVLENLGFDDLLKTSSLVITGEGKFDSQSLNGKITGNIISRANKHGVKCLVICGATEDGLSLPENVKILPLNSTKENTKDRIFETFKNYFLST
ncbi:MAG: glycerate kinase [Bacteroidales bacterium]|nr:glycerate kinase [Bacteroidales bacterium]